MSEQVCEWGGGGGVNAIKHGSTLSVCGLS